MIVIPIKDILLGQHDDGKFVRYDLVIKYMFLKKYYKKGRRKQFGFKPYDNLFLYKGTSVPHVRKAYRQYFKLIESFDEYGFRDDCPLSMDRRFFMHGGSHRLVLAIWHRMKEVPVEFVDKCRRSKRYHTKNWMKRHSGVKHMEALKRNKKRMFKRVGLC